MDVFILLCDKNVEKICKKNMQKKKRLYSDDKEWEKRNNLGF